jgi:hypothetical protein
VEWLFAPLAALIILGLVALAHGAAHVLGVLHKAMETMVHPLVLVAAGRYVAAQLVARRAAMVMMANALS